MDKDSVGSTITRRVLAGVILITLTLTAATPVLAQAPYTAPHSLPPIPEWPIIGPVLRALGIGQKEQAEVVELLPEEPVLPEFQIDTFEEWEILEEIEPGESVRVVISDTVINEAIAEALKENLGGSAAISLQAAAGELSLHANVDATLVEESGIDLPRISGERLKIDATMRAGSYQCRPYVEFKKISVNGWSFGLRPIAQRAINTRLPEVWPGDICIEKLSFEEGTVTLVGHYQE